MEESRRAEVEGATMVVSSPSKGADLLLELVRRYPRTSAYVAVAAAVNVAVAVAAGLHLIPFTVA